jgi:hypothetical protein
MFHKSEKSTDGAQSNRRKRARPFNMKNFTCQSALVAFAVASSAFIGRTDGFTFIKSSNPGLVPITSLRSSPSDTVQQVKPKLSSSKKKRDEAIKAMHRKQMDSALNNVDSKMLELLSDQYLYPSSNELQAIAVTKPRGRPDFVPGAMKHETMVKYHQRKEVIGQAQQLHSQQNGQAQQEMEFLKTQRANSNAKVKGTSRASTSTGLTDADSVTPKRRKRVVKNLPERKTKATPVSKGRKAMKGRAKANNLELQKYYRTELLTAKEEYELGIKVQLLVKCEQVHEGLSIELMRLPTIQEWSMACR